MKMYEDISEKCNVQNICIEVIKFCYHPQNTHTARVHTHTRARTHAHEEGLYTIQLHTVKCFVFTRI